MIRRALLIAFVLGIAIAQDALSENDLINQLFNSATESSSGSTATSTTTTTSLPPPTPSAPVEKINCTSGECVAKYLCKKSENTYVVDGELLFDLRFGEEEKRPCDILQTCCQEKSETPIIPPKLAKITDRCGFRNPDGLGYKIVGNNKGEAAYAEFPWMVAITEDYPIDDLVLKNYICGGSLIHPSVVLTAAHCIAGKDLSRLRIRAGEWDTQSQDEVWPDQTRTVKQVIIHEKFHKPTIRNDIALLILASPVDKANHISPVCLPPQGENFDNKRCFAMGWGKNVFGKEGVYSVILKKVQLPVVPHQDCQQYLRKTRLGDRFILDESLLCAGGEEGKDLCSGDGGSPLVCPVPNTVDQYYQAGIVAAGIGCGTRNVPGVYANVPLFRNWIDTQMQNAGFNQNSYSLK